MQKYKPNEKKRAYGLMEINKEEKATVELMVRIYCNAHHASEKDNLCEGCSEINTYASQRLEHCIYGNVKPTCEKCSIHCYSPKMRSEIQKVMRYAGPRVLFRAPILAIKHLFKNMRPGPAVNRQKK